MAQVPRAILAILGYPYLLHTLLSGVNVRIVIFVLLNILLPTVDVITDLVMIVKLFSGDYGCVTPKLWSEDYIKWQDCLQDPETYCRETKELNTTCSYKENEYNTEIYECRSLNLWSNDWKPGGDWYSCTSSPRTFCKGARPELCVFDNYPKFGVSLLVPFLINYLVCFLTWWRLETQKSSTFIFPILNIYPQLGQYNSLLL